MAKPIQPLLIDRFKADLQALAEPHGRIGIAYSGGPDSLALLLLARAAFPKQVAAATVDHGLRPESASEALHAASTCASLGIAHDILGAAIGPGGEGLQGEARRARYAALRDWARQRGVPILCTAHHADDQAETVLMRLQRGAGLSGLASIRPVKAEDDVNILRPLLAWSRRELRDIVEASGLRAVADPSNEDLRFDRVSMRRFLAANPDFESARLARSAAALRESEAALSWAADRVWDERVRLDQGFGEFVPDGLPPEIVRRILVRLLGELGVAKPPRGEDVQRLAAALARGASATLAGVKCVGGAAWTFRPEPPRRA
jgi:tRNA(Ile)-lysidine synthase